MRLIPLKLKERSTDIEIIMKQVIGAFYGKVRKIDFPMTHIVEIAFYVDRAFKLVECTTDVEIIIKQTI